MPGNTTKTQVPDEVSGFYDRTLLERAVSNFVHTRWAQIRDIPKNAGTLTVNFRRYGNLSAATTPLSEGITPTGSQLSVSTVTATVAQYGDFVTVTDVLSFSSYDAVLTESAEIMGDQGGDTLDQVTRDVLAAGTTITYVGQVSRGAITISNKITTTEVKKMVRTLKKNKARMITRMVDPSTGYNTTPLNACYVGICSPDTTYDLEAETNWIPVEKYSNKSDIMDGEVGSLARVRFVESPNAKVFAGAGTGPVDVHATIIMGMHAYGITRISGESMKNIVKPLGSAGSADPLDQRATSGWKATFVAKILNNDFIGRIEHAVTA